MTFQMVTAFTLASSNEFSSNTFFGLTWFMRLARAFFYSAISSTKYAVPLPQILSKLVVDLQAVS